MCGLSGVWNSTGTLAGRRERISRMVSALRHRGPDAVRTLIFRHGELGVARLAMVGGDAATQPWTTADGGSTLAFNGEIYNWRDLGERSLNAATSDTAVLANLLTREGVSGAGLLRGGFAFAWVDHIREKLWLVRDHFGQKPLYYSQRGSELWFASEIEALCAGGLVLEADDQRIADYLTLHFHHPGTTLFRGINCLAPGTWLSADTSGALKTGTLPEPNHSGPRDVRQHFEAAAHRQGQRSRPAVLFLSGGLDSTATLGALHAVGAPPEIALVGAFDEPSVQDERPYARMAAAAFGVPLVESRISSGMFQEVLNKTIRTLEMPVAGMGSVSSYLLAQRAREYGTVIYTGSGGDELFGGYERIRRLLLFGAQDAEPDGRYADLTSRMNAASTPWEAYGHAIDRRGRLGTFGGYELKGPLELVCRYCPDLIDSSRPAADLALDFERRVFLPGLLHVDDRTSARFGMESRSLFLDEDLERELRQFSCVDRSPPDAPRRLFRQQLGCFLPPSIAARRDKVGFPVPWAEWIRGPLKGFAWDLLSTRRFLERGGWTLTEMDRLLSDDGARGRVVFGLLSLALWYELFIDNRMSRDQGSDDAALPASFEAELE